MNLRRAILLLFLANLLSEVHATSWQVGPTRPYPAPSAVASLVANGDTVNIDAGLYTGDVAVWYANNLYLRCPTSGGAHLEAGGNSAQGKAIWVIKGNDCKVSNIEFSGCQVPDKNGAGIRQEGKNLEVISCYFHHNEMGILTSNDGVSDYVFRVCEFSDNGYGDGYSHNIYVGHANSLTMWFCYSHDSKIGHLVKSRANNNYLYYNRLTGENGDGSYEIDLPNGGTALLIGNIIEQSSNSQNGGIISFGLEGATNPEQALVLSNNTLVNDRFDGRFVQCSDQTNLVKMANNLFLGPGQLLQGNTANLDTTTNIWHLNIADGALLDPANYDYHPTVNSSCLDAGTAPVFYNSFLLKPAWQYKHPLSSEMRNTQGTSLDIGAFEFMPDVSEVQQVLAITGFRISPNPMVAGRTSIVFNAPLQQQSQLRVLNFEGKTIFENLVSKGEKGAEIDLGECPNGLYLIDIEGFAKQKILKT